MNGKVAKALRKKAAEHTEKTAKERVYFHPKTSKTQLVLDPNCVRGAIRLVKQEWKLTRLFESRGWTF